MNFSVHEQSGLRETNCRIYCAKFHQYAALHEGCISKFILIFGVISAGRLHAGGIGLSVYNVRASKSYISARTGSRTA